MERLTEGTTGSPPVRLAALRCQADPIKRAASPFTPLTPLLRFEIR